VQSDLGIIGVVACTNGHTNYISQAVSGQPRRAFATRKALKFWISEQRFARELAGDALRRK